MIPSPLGVSEPEPYQALFQATSDCSMEDSSFVDLSIDEVEVSLDAFLYFVLSFHSGF